MRIGLVTKWFNRGQAYVAAHLRTALEELDHETFVLARPTKDKGPIAGYIDDGGRWDQPNVTIASSWEVPGEEFVSWAAANRLDAAMFDNSYQFDEVEVLRASGIKTIGRFVWEHFGPEHVEPAKRAYDVIYSVTLAEQARYREFGIESPYFPWGCHPEFFEVTPNRDPELVTFYFPGALMGPRKPHRQVIEAFSRAKGDHLRLLVKAQVDRRTRYLQRALERDSRIALIVEDLPHDDHLQLFADCQVCLGPSRWEGLGLFLYEAIAVGMPIITNDDPPMNEVVIDGQNGLLVRSKADGTADSGIPAFTPDVKDLARAIERIADRAQLERLSAGAVASQATWSWRHTVDGLGAMIAAIEHRITAS